MLIAAHEKGRTCSILLMILATIKHQFLGALPYIEKKKAYKLRHDRPSVRIYQFGSHQKDLHQI
jgi:hypothetical protein